MNRDRNRLAQSNFSRYLSLLGGMIVVGLLTGCSATAKEVKGNPEASGQSTEVPKPVVQSEEVFLSEDFKSVLLETHSFVQARRKHPGIFAFFKGEHPYGLDGGNEAATLSEESLDIIKKSETLDGVIDLGQLGKFSKAPASESEVEPDQYILSNIFPAKHFASDQYDLVVSENKVEINGETFQILTNLGFQREALDVLFNKSKSYYVEITEKSVSLFETTPDDYSFGPRGNLLSDLPRLEK